MKIGITDCGAKYPIYERWILSQNLDNLTIIKLGYQLDNLAEIKQCDGVVLTGGEDIHPKYYGKEMLLSFCNANFMDEQRDEFEWKVCEYIFENKIPLLGICRGLQLVNVFLGGTLIPDIPSAGGENHSKFYEGKDRYHSINILPDSALAKITNCSKGSVNSAHHQSVDLIAKSLIVSALSEDNIVESLEWASASFSQHSASLLEKNHFLMLVQWHPERLNDSTNPFSELIRKAFIEGVKSQIS